MKNLIFIGLILLLSCQGNQDASKENVIEKELEETIVSNDEESDSAFIEKNQNQKATNQKDGNGWQQGKWIIYGRDIPEKGYPADGKIEEGIYRDGKKVGHWIYWNKDNSIQSESNYTNGELDGETIHYDFFTDAQTHIYFEMGRIFAVSTTPIYE